MDREAVRGVVRATLAVLERLTRRTRTPADDLMAQILRANEERLVDAVLALSADPTRSPSDEEVAEVLKRVGISV